MVLFALGQGEEGDDVEDGDEIVRVTVVVYVSASASFGDGVVADGDGEEVESEFESGSWDADVAEDAASEAIHAVQGQHATSPTHLSTH
jgi:hypothetical protein